MRHRKGSTENAILFLVVLAIMGTAGGIWLISPNSWRGPANAPMPIEEEVSKAAPPPPPEVTKVEFDEEEVIEANEQIAEAEQKAEEDKEKNDREALNGTWKPSWSTDTSDDDASNNAGKSFQYANITKTQVPKIPNNQLGSDKVTTDRFERDPKSFGGDNAFTDMIDQAYSDEPAHDKISEVIANVLSTTTEPLRLKDGKRHSPRTWTVKSSRKQVTASIQGADHVSKRVKLKRKGKAAQIVGWDKLSDDDVTYLEMYCFSAIQQRKVDAYTQRQINFYNAAKSRRNTAKHERRSQLSAHASARRHAEAKHAYDYRYNPAYRDNFNRNANRAASVARSYAYGAGLSSGGRLRVWVPGKQNSNGTYTPGYFR